MKSTKQLQNPGSTREQDIDFGSERAGIRSKQSRASRETGIFSNFICLPEGYQATYRNPTLQAL